MTCTCEHWSEHNPDATSSCDIHVDCDQGCKALSHPETPDEVRAAYEHWRGHSYLSGCSHGC